MNTNEHTKAMTPLAFSISTAKGLKLNTFLNVDATVTVNAAV